MARGSLEPTIIKRSSVRAIKHEHDSMVKISFEGEGLSKYMVFGGYDLEGYEKLIEDFMKCQTDFFVFDAFHYDDNIFKRESK